MINSSAMKLNSKIGGLKYDQFQIRHLFFFLFFQTIKYDISEIFVPCFVNLFPNL